MEFPFRSRIVSLVEPNDKGIKLIQAELFHECLRRNHIRQTTHSDAIEGARGREGLDGDIVVALIEILLQLASRFLRSESADLDSKETRRRRRWRRRLQPWSCRGRLV